MLTRQCSGTSPVAGICDALITDSSKFGCVCLHRIIGLNEITALVTDTAAPEYIGRAKDRLSGARAILRELVAIAEKKD